MPRQRHHLVMAQAGIMLCLTLLFNGAALAQSSGKAVLLAINDVYRIEGINNGSNGGLPRVRALRAELERTTPGLLFLHAGDFLSPSFLGRTYLGAQMIDLMNVMDGKPASGTHDSRMFVTFGNHEFDDTHCGKKGPLADLVSASEFTWLGSNLDFGHCKNLSSLAGNKNLAANTIIESGGLRIGLYSLTLSRRKYAAVASDPLQASCAQVKALRAKGVDAVVALTHLPWSVDLHVLGLGPDGHTKIQEQQQCTPDIVVGGHDHISLSMPKQAPRLFKADADAVSAWVIEIEKRTDGSLQIRGRLELLGSNRTKDPLVQRLADFWLTRHDERFCLSGCFGKARKDLKECLSSVQNGACLKQTIARANSLIETEEIANRSFETGFGSWVADQMRRVGNADVGFLNAGAIRLNYNLNKGVMITRRHIEQMFPFKNKIVVRDVPARAIWQAMSKAVKNRGEGAWAHFSGIAVRLIGVEGKQQVQQILLRNRGGNSMEITAHSNELVRVASLSFVLANGDGHGFRLCPALADVWACKDKLEADPRWPLVGDQSDLSGFVRAMLKNHGAGSGLQLSVDRRLCDPRQAGCLIDRWQSSK